MTDLPILSAQDAAAAGMKPLTFPYLLSKERPMLDKVAADMRRCGCRWVCIPCNRGKGKLKEHVQPDEDYNCLEVWRVMPPLKKKY